MESPTSKVVAKDKAPAEVPKAPVATPEVVAMDDEGYDAVY